MKIGVIGLGRMGSAIAARLLDAHFQVIGYDPHWTSADNNRLPGITLVDSTEKLSAMVDVIWLMVPAGSLIDTILDTITPLIKKGAVIIDGGNSKFTDSISRAQRLQKMNLSFLDCGTSGGVHGRTNGFCLMIGGIESVYQQLLPLWQAVAAPQGYAYVGPSGAGHYVKMVHNGIEYALLQAYAEGFHILKEGSFAQVPLDLEKISALWNTSSVIRSWILDLTHNIFHEHGQQLDEFSGFVAESGMGKWTLEEASKHHIPAHLIQDALDIRYQSQKDGGNYATKLVALMRNQFGAHAVRKIDEGQST